MFGGKANKPIFDKLPPSAAKRAGLSDPELLSAESRASIRDSEKPPEGTLVTRPRLSESGEVNGIFHWTVRDAFEGTQVFGETGSGKTSGSGATIARALLRPPATYTGKPFGGLVLTAKATDAHEWLDPKDGFLAQANVDPNKVIVLGEKLTPGITNPKAEAGRRRDIDTSRFFNFLDYEYSESGGATFNLVQLFLTALESGSQGNTGQEDAYWMDALRQLLTNAIDLVVYATGKVTLTEICGVIQTAPQSREQAESRKWQKPSSTCWTYLEEAGKRLIEAHRAASEAGEAPRLKEAEADLRNFKQIVNYWLLDFAGLADRTRSVIVSTFTSKVTGLTRWPLYELLCYGSMKEPGFVDIVKETRDGKIVIINLPVKRYTEIGRFAQVLIKTVWQRGIERHPDIGHPVFLWADEAQFFATKEDVLFQTTARSSRCATVYLTQNICNYYAMMPGKDPKSATDALLGNLTTKIFHANGDPTTNDWAQRLFGNESVWLSNRSVQTEGKTSMGSAESAPLPIVHAKDFAMLRRGSEDQKRIVEALIFRSGNKLEGARSTLIRTFFEQTAKTS
jgi:hypothetical protein